MAKLNNEIATLKIEKQQLDKKIEEQAAEMDGLMVRSIYQRRGPKILIRSLLQNSMHEDRNRDYEKYTTATRMLDDTLLELAWTRRELEKVKVRMVRYHLSSSCLNNPPVSGDPPRMSKFRPTRILKPSQRITVCRQMGRCLLRVIKPLGEEMMRRRLLGYAVTHLFSYWLTHRNKQRDIAAPSSQQGQITKVHESSEMPTAQMEHRVEPQPTVRLQLPSRL